MCVGWCVSSVQRRLLLLRRRRRNCWDEARSFQLPRSRLLLLQLLQLMPRLRVLLLRAR